MTDLTDKAIIQQHILRYFDQFTVGDVFKSGQLVRYVNARTKHRHWPDSILKYLRLLRQDEELNYTHIEGKQSCKFKIIALGEPHLL